MDFILTKLIQTIGCEEQIWSPLKVNSLYVWLGNRSGNWLNCCFRILDLWYGSSSRENKFFSVQLVRMEFNDILIDTKGDDSKSRIHNIFLHSIDPSVSLSLSGQWTTFTKFSLGLFFAHSSFCSTSGLAFLSTTVLEKYQNFFVRRSRGYDLKTN